MAQIDKTVIVSMNYHGEVGFVECNIHFMPPELGLTTKNVSEPVLEETRELEGEEAYN